jgi:hypothetical protein
MNPLSAGETMLSREMANLRARLDQTEAVRRAEELQRTAFENERRHMQAALENERRERHMQAALENERRERHMQAAHIQDALVNEKRKRRALKLAFEHEKQIMRLALANANKDLQAALEKQDLQHQIEQLRLQMSQRMQQTRQTRAREIPKPDTEHLKTKTAASPKQEVRRRRKDYHRHLQKGKQQQQMEEVEEEE